MVKTSVLAQRKRRAQVVNRHKFGRSRPGVILQEMGSELANTGKLRPKNLVGHCPPYNDDVCWVSDPFEGKLYMVHGTRPGEETEDIPTSDFYCLDTTTFRWKDLTESLTFRDPKSLFSLSECKREVKELPELTLAACALMRIHDTSFMLIFGGHDVDADEASSKLIVINLRHLEWWYQSIEGGPVVGRINPTIATVNQKLFIFGGYSHFEGDGAPHASYSVAELADGNWTWKARDVPYPQNVPQGSIFGHACPVYGGRKILLTPWRTTKMAERDYINFTEENIFCFHVERQKFQPVDVTGDFPKGVEWYYTTSLDKLVLEKPKRASAASKRSPPAWTAASASSASTTSASTSTSEPSSSSSFSALICGWVNWPGARNDPTPEVWHLELTPTERIRKLDIGPLVHELGSGFEGAALVGDRLCLLGSSVDSDEHDIGAALNPDAKYDRCLEISLRSRGVIPG